MALALLSSFCGSSGTFNPSLASLHQPQRDFGKPANSSRRFSISSATRTIVNDLRVSSFRKTPELPSFPGLIYHVLKAPGEHSRDSLIDVFNACQVWMDEHPEKGERPEFMTDQSSVESPDSFHSFPESPDDYEMFCQHVEVTDVSDEAKASPSPCSSSPSSSSSLLLDLLTGDESLLNLQNSGSAPQTCKFVHYDPTSGPLIDFSQQDLASSGTVSTCTSSVHPDLESLDLHFPVLSDQPPQSQKQQMCTEANQPAAKVTASTSPRLEQDGPRENHVSPVKSIQPVRRRFSLPRTTSRLLGAGLRPTVVRAGQDSRGIEQIAMSESQRIACIEAAAVVKRRRSRKFQPKSVTSDELQAEVSTAAPDNLTRTPKPLRAGCNKEESSEFLIKRKPLPIYPPILQVSEELPEAHLIRSLTKNQPVGEALSSADLSQLRHPSSPRPYQPFRVYQPYGTPSESRVNIDISTFAMTAPLEQAVPASLPSSELTQIPKVVITHASQIIEPRSKSTTRCGDEIPQRQRGSSQSSDKSQEQKEKDKRQKRYCRLNPSLSSDPISEKPEAVTPIDSEDQNKRMSRVTAQKLLTASTQEIFFQVWEDSIQASRDPYFNPPTVSTPDPGPLTAAAATTDVRINANLGVSVESRIRHFEAQSGSKSTSTSSPPAKVDGDENERERTRPRTRPQAIDFRWPRFSDRDYADPAIEFADRKRQELRRKRKMVVIG